MPITFNNFVDYVFRKVQQNQDREKSHNTCYFQPGSDGVNLSSGNTRTSKKIGSGLFVACNVIGL